MTAQTEQEPDRVWTKEEFENDFIEINRIGCYRIVVRKEDDKLGLLQYDFERECYHGWIDDLKKMLQLALEARRSQLKHLPPDRRFIEMLYGRVWDTEELEKEFTVLGFLAPYVVVVRKSDNVLGSLEYIDRPRLYFNWKED